MPASSSPLNQFEVRLFGIIGELSRPKRRSDEILHRQDLVEDLGLDSLAFVELIVKIESAFNLEFPSDRLISSAYNTVQSLAEEVSRLQHGT